MQILVNLNFSLLNFHMASRNANKTTIPGDDDNEGGVPMRANRTSRIFHME